MKKAYVIVVAVMLFTASIILSPAVAGAETTIIEIDDYVVSPVVADGRPELLIEFIYKEQWLSLYWEGKLDTSRTLFVELWFGETCIECIDAGYAD